MKKLFWFRKSTKPLWGSVMLKITDKDSSDKYEFDTGIKLYKTDWLGNDLRIKLLKHNYNESTDVLKERSRKLNNELATIEEGINKVLTSMTILGYQEISPKRVGELYKALQSKGLEPVKENIEKVLQSHTKEAPVFKAKEYTLLEIVDILIEKKRLEVSKSTLQTYEYRREGLYRYLLKIRKPFYPADKFKAGALDEFCQYLKAQGMGRNRINRYAIMITSAFELAILRELVTEKNNIVYYVYEKEATEDLRHLTAHKFKELIDLDIAKHINEKVESVSILNDTRNQFAFMCLTGLHLCDYLKLKSENLQKINEDFFLISKRQKTTREFNIKLHPIALAIIDFYGGIEKLPKRKKDSFNPDLKRIETMLGLNIGLSSKIGRKTLAHLALNEWMVDADTLARFMGLKNSRYVTAYGQVERNRVSELMNFNRKEKDVA